MACGLAHPTVAWHGSVCRAGAGEQLAHFEGKLARYLTASLGWQGLGAAMRHYVLAGDVPAFAAALTDAAAHGGSSEEDLFLVRAVLATAAAPSQQPAAQLQAARRLLEAFVGASGRAPPQTPLINFASLFLEALQQRQERLVELLLQRYKPSLDRDPALWQLVEQCRGAVFGGPASGGLLDLFSLLGGP